LRFGEDGLIPAVIQDAESQAVLMVGFMNAEAVELTRASGRVHYWSRSRRRLWRKGETSGHEQLVEDILVNCELNSLLITVRQVGAVCHDGYPTCYYRRLESDNRLAVVRERVFDPATVYDRPEASAGAESGLERAAHEQFSAYLFLRDHDLAAISGTSNRLRAETDTVSSRVADELRELAGALDGSHRHHDLVADVRLEGGQVLYWVTLAALRSDATWEGLRSDRALTTSEAGISVAATAAMLRADADRWESERSPGEDAVARCHATLALVGQTCLLAGVSPLALVEADLADLSAKPYLAGVLGDSVP
jgi:phosphoribosyl-AMP cyclohydrolase